MGQDNSLRRQALLDAMSYLEEIKEFEELGFTVKTPEEVEKCPAAFITGGSGERIPTDTIYFHYEHSPVLRIYVYEEDSIGGGKLALKLEDLIKLILDKFDAKFQEFRTTTLEYDFYISEVATDEGAIAAMGIKKALAQITVQLKFPSADA